MRAFVPVIYKIVPPGRSQSYSGIWKLVPLGVELEEVDPRDAPVVASCRSTSRYEAHLGSTDYRAHAGSIWEPAHNRRTNGLGVGVVPAAQGLGESTLADIKRLGLGQFWHGYVNALVDQRRITGLKPADDVEIDRDASSSAAREAVEAALAIAGSTILVDGQPLRRSYGPFLTLNSRTGERPVRHPVMEWTSPARRWHNLYTLGGVVRADRSGEAVSILADSVGARPADVVGGFIVTEVHEPSAFSGGFDDFGVSAEASALLGIARLRKLCLPEMSTGLVSALAGLRTALKARDPGLYSDFDHKAYGQWLRPDDDFGVPPGDDLVAPLEAFLDQCPEIGWYVETFRARRAIEDRLSRRTSAEADATDDETLAALAF